MKRPVKSDFWENGIFMEKTYFNAVWGYVEHIEKKNKDCYEKSQLMADSLNSVYNDLEECDDWGTDIHTDTIEKVIVSLNDFGVKI